MSLIRETANFIGELNKFILGIDIQDSKAIETIQRIRTRVDNIIQKTASAEGSAVTLLSKLAAAEQPESDIIYIRREGTLRAAITRSPLKPVIVKVEPIAEECCCPDFELSHFSSRTECIYVDSEEKLFEVDRCYEQVCIEVLDHTYRTFDGFSCFIAVYTITGIIYIIDAIKFRETIPRLRLLRCGVHKYIHCAECVERLLADFGDIGCYRNFSIFPRNIYVDWRIRPLREALTELIIEDLEEMVQKVNNRMITEKHRATHKVEIVDFIDKFNLPQDCPMLPELLKLRSYLARKYDEGVQYVMTDSQLLTLLEATPTTIDAFDQAFTRISSVLRLHAGDFILILRRRAHIFSLERLKERKAEEAADQMGQALQRQLSSEKYRSFGKHLKPEESSEEFQISSCEH